MKWELQTETIPTTSVELRQLLLYNRQVTDQQAFFAPPHPLDLELSQLGFDLKQLQVIQQRLRRAKAQHEQVVIFGDYDADGICATTVLWRSLQSLGVEARPFIPHRLKHGYGLSVKALDDLLRLHPEVKLIITVDNGIVAHRALAYAAQQGIEVIVTDHHQRDQQELEATAVFHSTVVCGCSVAWFLSRELGVKRALLQELLALVAIATVTDLMPVLGVNRGLLMHGLSELRRNQQVGLQALLTVAQVEPSKIDAYTLGFQLGPRINAMGRLADGMDAVRLLCTSSASKAKQLSQVLHDTNLDRQNLTVELVGQAEAVVLREAGQQLIFVSSADYHEGIIGLIAGRLTEKFHKPSIVVSVGPTTSKASARSLPGFNITEFIRSFSDDLLEMGGHPLAAGFAVTSQKLDELKSKMQERALQLLGDQTLEKSLRIDSILPPNLLQLEIKNLLDEFAPFGLGNPQPVFLLTRVRIVNWRLLGQQQQHLKLMVRIGTQELPVLAWQRAELMTDLDMAAQFDLACTLESNTYRGTTSLQLILKDIKKASS